MPESAVVIADALKFVIGRPGEILLALIAMIWPIIMLGMNSALCTKTIRTIKQRTATTSP